MTVLDGGMGTLLQAAGLPAGKDPCDWNVENPGAIAAVHRAYAAAGCDIVLTNTFGANRLKYRGALALGEVVRSAVKIARAAAPTAKVALDVGPTGRLLKPAGDLPFDEAYAAFAETVRLAVESDAPPDMVFVETMGDTHELKAAVLAAKENCDLPVYATVALGENGKLLTGASVECVATLLEGLGVDAYGFNCGIGPDRMLPFVERLAEVSTKPIIVKPNAGMPRVVDGETVFDISPAEFAAHVSRLVAAGAEFVGGCCGTTPEHIAALPKGLAAPQRVKVRRGTVVSSGSVALGLHAGEGLIIGERINPTGKKKLKDAYARGDTAYVLREAVNQVDAGAAVLDVNCGVPGLDEVRLLDATVAAVESVVAVPLQIDTADPKALEAALRRVNGCPLVNSVNGKRESMDAVFPLVRKYGGAIVALCLDESGIPSTADGRLAIARRILDEGAKYGFTVADFVFDALTLSVSTDPNAAMVTLETVRRLTDELGANTVLGVSNVSFGLPARAELNNAMYALAKRAGLSAAIANPSLIRDEITSAAEDVLLCRDLGCARWIAAHAVAEETPSSKPSAAAGLSVALLKSAVIHGLKEDAADVSARLIAAGFAPMELIDGGVVAALEEVGSGFERGRVFLPQLLGSADAAGAAFEEISRHRLADGYAAATRGSAPIVLATVKGDVHDIGKNICRSLLANYGYDVIDLGRDVPAEAVVEAVKRNGAGLVGLSALMTTTVGAMADTVRRLRSECPDCPVTVGGAVVTAEYAASIGADHYTGDAMELVRLAGRILRKGE